MARIPRSFTVVPHCSVHKIWRGHNREWNLGTEGQKRMYLCFLNEDMECPKYEVGAKISAVTVMSNHTHEIYKIEKPENFSNHMRRHHSRYGRYFNDSQDRCGKVAQDRPKTCLLANSHYEMISVFYVHANPLRAGIVKDARDYAWTTHGLYAFGKREPWMRNITFPEWYMSLGRTMEQRRRRYRQLFSKYLERGGRRKQRFLREMFFGPIVWMEERKRGVRSYSRSRGPD